MNPNPFDAPPGTMNTPEMSQALDQAVADLRQRQLQLEQTGLSGANWFWWVAGLSLVNTVVMHTGGATHFVVGLAITLVADVLAIQIGTQEPQIATLMTVVAIGFDVFVAGLFAGIGWLARKRYQAVFGIGMFLYLLDGGGFALLGDWMSTGFHAFALFGMWNGFQAFRRLAETEEAVEMMKMQGVKM